MRATVVKEGERGAPRATPATRRTAGTPAMIQTGRPAPRRPGTASRSARVRATIAQRRTTATSRQRAVMLCQAYRPADRSPSFGLGGTASGAVRRANLTTARGSASSQRPARLTRRDTPPGGGAAERRAGETLRNAVATTAEFSSGPREACDDGRMAAVRRPRPGARGADVAAGWG